VLAGGRSTRFGADKASATWGGGSVLDRAVSILGEVCDDVVVVSSRAEHDASHRKRIPDLREGGGPLAGVEAALRHAESVGAGAVFVLACDVFGANAEDLSAILRALGPDDDAVAPWREGAPGFEPLCAMYRTSCAPHASRLLDAGIGGAHRLLEAVQGRVVPVLDRPLVNVNTPEDLAALPRLGPTVVCVVGKKKSGKTTTVVGLVRALTARGHEVMTVKHGHGFDVDREGSDSWKHRHVGGASRVVLAGPDEFAVMGSWAGKYGGREPALEELVLRHLGDADIVVAEGFKASGFPRIEVFRRSAHDTPVLGSEGAGEAGLWLAVLTDDPDFEAPCPVRDVDDPERFTWLADVVERLHRERGRP
jgi:molybdopterin-guanine dinucleotide biosynthesis protein B